MAHTEKARKIIWRFVSREIINNIISIQHSKYRHNSGLLLFTEEWMEAKRKMHTSNCYPEKTNIECLFCFNWNIRMHSNDFKIFSRVWVGGSSIHSDRDEERKKTVLFQSYHMIWFISFSQKAIIVRKDETFNILNVWKKRQKNSWKKKTSNTLKWFWYPSFFWLLKKCRSKKITRIPATETGYFIYFI